MENSRFSVESRRGSSFPAVRTFPSCAGASGAAPRGGTSPLLVMQRFLLIKQPLTTELLTAPRCRWVLAKPFPKETAPKRDKQRAPGTSHRSRARCSRMPVRAKALRQRRRFPQAVRSRSSEGKGQPEDEMKAAAAEPSSRSRREPGTPQRERARDRKEGAGQPGRERPREASTAARAVSLSPVGPVPGPAPAGGPGRDPPPHPPVAAGTGSSSSPLPGSSARPWARRWRREGRGAPARGGPAPFNGPMTSRGWRWRVVTSHRGVGASSAGTAAPRTCPARLPHPPAGPGGGPAAAPDPCLGHRRAARCDSPCRPRGSPGHPRDTKGGVRRPAASSCPPLCNGLAWRGAKSDRLVTETSGGCQGSPLWIFSPLFSCGQTASLGHSRALLLAQLPSTLTGLFS